MSQLQASLLGRPRFERDGQPVELSPPRAAALFAYLAARRQPQTRDHLLAVLWPESATDAARKNLRNTLWMLRKQLGDDVVAAHDDRIGLAPGLRTDLDEFEQTAGTPAPAAVALYRGVFADGLRLDDAPDFEIWLAGERERYARLFLRAIDLHIQAQRRSGHWPSVVELAGRALDQDALQEPMHRARMEAYARLGQRAEAMRQYDTLRALLERELGVEPLPETESVRRAILSGALAPDETAGPSSPRREPPPAGIAPAFVGRRAELDALSAELDAAAGGHARVALVTGEMGIGKSRLCREWAARLPPGPAVLELRCLEAAQSLPLAPCVDMLRRSPCQPRLADAASPLPPIWLAEIARLLPEVRAGRPDLPPPAMVPPDEERRRVFEALVQALMAAAPQALVLIVDDAHWADQATLDWLGYAAQRLADQPLLVVMTYRAEEAGAGLTRLIAGWTRQGLTRRIDLPKLTDAESAALAAALIAPDRLPDGVLRAEVERRIRVQSGGNPYFLIELCQVAPGDLPPALREVIQARLAQLPGMARQVLQGAAVLEPDFDFAALRRTAGRGEQETLDALDTLLGAAVLTERGGRYAFAHPLVASVVRDGLSGARRTFLHRRAAEAIAAANAGRLAPVAGRLAIHYDQAGDLDRAAHYAEMAAADAMSLSAAAEAANFYRLAIDRRPTPGRHTGLGQALLWLGRLDESRAACQAGLDLAESSADRPGMAAACLGLASLSLAAGRGDEVVRWAEMALERLGDHPAPRLQAEAQLMLGAGTQMAGEGRGGTLAAAERHLAEAARLAADNDLADAAAHSRFELGNLLAQRGALKEAVRAYEESIVAAQAARNPFMEVLGHNNAACHALLAGDRPAARRHIEEGMRLADACALDLPRQYLYSTRGELALADGRWEEAEDWFRRGLAEAGRAGNAKQAANYRANLGLAARGRGDLDAALALLEGALDEATRLSAAHLAAQARLWLAELHLERGERAAAQDSWAAARRGLADGERRGLLAWADRLAYNFFSLE